MMHNKSWVGSIVGWLLLAGTVASAQAQPDSRREPQVASPEVLQQKDAAYHGSGDEDATETNISARAFEFERPLIGADISFVPSQEDRGTVFSDQGVEKDVLEILANHKFNWIRLRLFVDPTAENGYSRQGYCGLEQTLAMARRIEAAGMKFLLDFHYSDTWADPGKQFTPAAWQGLSDDELADKMYEYTRDVIKRFIAEGVASEMVQIGNEIHNGFVWPQGRIKNSPETFGALLRRASEAVRDVDPKIKIMVHPALGGDNKRSVAFFDLVLRHNVVFDVIGQSYYPEHHGTLDDLRNNLTDLATRYRKPIVVVEYKEHKKEVNEIVRDLPDGLGWGTFIWEATSPRWGGLFDRNGATNEKIDIYPEFFERFETAQTPEDGASSIKVIRDIAYREGDSEAWLTTNTSISPIRQSKSFSPNISNRIEPHPTCDSDSHYGVPGARPSRRQRSRSAKTAWNSPSYSVSLARCAQDGRAPSHNENCWTCDAGN